MTAPILRTGRLYWLARYFEQHPKEYNQTTFCGTAMCVGGLTVWQWGTVAHRRKMADAITIDRDCFLNFNGIGRALLGLTESQAQHLFSGAPCWLTGWGAYYARKRHVREVVATLRHLARTGEMLTHPPDVS